MSPNDDFIADDEDFIPDTDAGPEARRALAGKPPSPRSEVVDTVTSGVDNPVADVGARRVEELEQAHNDLTDARHAIGAAALAGPVAGEVAGAARGLGAPKLLAKLLGGATSGATATTVAEGTPEHAAQGAVVGTALAGGSELMKFVVGRAIAPVIARQMGRASPQAFAGKFAVEDMVNAAKKYELTSIKNPQVAKEAIEAGIKRSQQSIERAWSAAQEASRDSARNPLVAQAMREFGQAHKEQDVLKAMLKVVTKVAQADAYKATLAERVMTGAGKAAKTAVLGGAGYGAYKLVSGK